MLGAVIALAAAAPARAESIFGVVTDAVTHAGLADFEVCAYPALPTQAEGEAGKKCTEPEPAPETPGEYVLGGIPPGSYKVAFLPDPESKYEAEFYDNQRSWADAAVLAVPTGTAIDAALEEVKASEGTKEQGSSSEGAQAPAPVAVPPTVLPVPPKPKPLRCKKSFRKKKVKGKVRCVKVPRPKHPQNRKRPA